MSICDRPICDYGCRGLPDCPGTPAAVARLEAEVNRLRTAIIAVQDKLVAGEIKGAVDDILWFDEITTLWDHFELALKPEN